MNAPREAVFQALFTLLENVADFRTTSRRVRLWSQVDPPDQPAAFQTQTSQKALVSGRGMPTKWELFAEWTIYAHSGEDPSATPSTQLNELLDAVDAAFPNTSPQTLGGLVDEARIFGEIKTDEGALGAQAVAIVPIRIITT